MGTTIRAIIVRIDARKPGMVVLPTCHKRVTFRDPTGTKPFRKSQGTRLR